MAGCEQDAVRRLHRRHVGDAVLMAQRSSSVKPAVDIPPLLDKAPLLFQRCSLRGSLAKAAGNPAVWRLVLALMA